MLAAGMGAGIGAIFRAPLAGAVFAGEIFYSDADLEADVIVPAAAASVVAYSVYTNPCLRTRDSCRSSVRTWNILSCRRLSCFRIRCWQAS